MVGQNEFVKFFVVSVNWAFIAICVYTTAFEVSILRLNRCFRLCRVRIILIKPIFFFFWLEQYFPYQKAMLYQHRKFAFFYCFENLQFWTNNPIWLKFWHVPFAGLYFIKSSCIFFSVTPSTNKALLLLSDVLAFLVSLAKEALANKFTRMNFKEIISCSHWGLKFHLVNKIIHIFIIYKIIMYLKNAKK